MARGRGKSIDWGNLVKEASEFVVANQNASYEFLRSKFPNIGVGTVSRLLQRLQTKKLVRRGKKRAWIVLVNPDGTPKDASSLPPPRRFYKKRRKGSKTASPEGITLTRLKLPRGVKPMREEVQPDDKTEVSHPSMKKKIDFLRHLATLAEGEKKVLLLESADDLVAYAREDTFLKALKD